MSLILTRPKAPYTKTFHLKREVSLSTYFPEGTRYFYGYPAGEDSDFLNLVPPTVEELVAERAISCAGQHVSVVGFASTYAPNISRELLDRFSVPQLNKNQLVLLPKHINASLKGADRNRVIKESLLHMIKDNNLVMAQPYTSKDMNSVYQLPSKLISYLNNKNNMSQYIDGKLLPKRLGTYKNGLDFAQNCSKINLPYVVKAASSSCGDGVYICLNKNDLEEALQNLKELKGSILVERYIKATKNYGIHFGIPYNTDKPIDFLGVNEQITTEKGEFIGGTIEASTFPPELLGIKHYLRNEVLPAVRSMGWYGVGGFDVLCDAKNRLYFIDCNFRMTGMSAYHFLVANQVIKAPLISFSGQLQGSQTDLESRLLPYCGQYVEHKFMQLIALSRQGRCWNFNAAVFFDTKAQLYDRVAKLLEAGVSSRALELVAELASQ